MRRIRSATLLAGLGALTLAAVGCGGGDDFPNENRLPNTIEITAKVDDQKVVVSPSEVGAGLAVFTVSNQSDDEIELTFDGPTEGSSDRVGPGQVVGVKLQLEPGDYEVTAGPLASVRPDRLRVGPERRSAQNDLLLP